MYHLAQIFCGDRNFGLDCHIYWHAKVTDHQLAVLIRAWCFMCESLWLIRTKEEKEGNKKVGLPKDKKEEMMLVEKEGSMEEGNKNVGLPKDVKEEMMLVEKEELLDFPSTKVVRRMTNFGITCYYNSVLQNLLSMKRLRVYYSKLCRSPHHPITSNFWSLLFASSFVDGDLEPFHSNLFNSICSIEKKYKKNQQQDCHEFLIHFRDGLLRENNSFVADIFEGEFSTTLSCCQCGHTKTSHEKFYDLTLSLTSEERSAVEEESFTCMNNVTPARENDCVQKNGSSAVKADNAEIYNTSNTSGRCFLLLTGYIDDWLVEQSVKVIVNLDEEYSSKEEEEKKEEGEVPAAAKVGIEGSIKDKEAKLNKEDSIDAKEKKKKKKKRKNLKKEEKEEPTKDAKGKDKEKDGMEEKKEEEKRDGPSNSCGWHPCICNENSSEVPKLPESERGLLTDKEDQTEDKGIQTLESFPVEELSTQNSNLNRVGEFRETSYVSSAFPGSVQMFDYDASSSSDSWSQIFTDSDLLSYGIVCEDPTASKRDSSMSNKGPLSIEKCLDLFTASERISRKCDHCQHHLKDGNSGPQKVEAIKIDRIFQAPPILTIHLKRFEQDELGITKKIDSHVSFPEVLDLTPYMDPNSGETKQTRYRLIGVVVHIGRSMDTGHYISYVRGTQGEGCDEVVVEGEGDDPLWFEANDLVISEVSLEEVLKSKAYLLFYEIL